MLTVISISLAVLASVLAILAGTFVVEVVAGVLVPQTDRFPVSGEDNRRRVAVLVPAHNEGAGLLRTLSDIRTQLLGSDRLVVVADNCTDDTASIAAGSGAEVVVRNDPNLRGKGYALTAGLDYLASNPPDIVVMIDADCRLAESAIDRLAVACASVEGPVQASDLMVSPQSSEINHRVAEFAWRVKNWVRPLGLRALGLPCQLMGTGMAFPWNVVRSVDLATGSIVEDLRLGVDLALAGRPPVFYPFPGVTSEFPASIEGARSQRLRWEQGHIGTILAIVPRLIFQSLVQGRPVLLAMALDLAVPPLSLLSIMLVSMFAVSGVAALLGCASTALVINALSLMGFACAILFSWFRYGRDVLPAKDALLILPYVLQKIPTYLKILSGLRISQWVRADRRKR